MSQQTPVPGGLILYVITLFLITMVIYNVCIFIFTWNILILLFLCISPGCVYENKHIFIFILSFEDYLMECHKTCFQILLKCFGLDVQWVITTKTVSWHLSVYIVLIKCFNNFIISSRHIVLTLWKQTKYENLKGEIEALELILYLETEKQNVRLIRIASVLTI